MPVVRVPLSVSQFSELMGIDPARFNGVEVDKRSSRVTLVLEPEDDMPTNHIMAARQAAGIFAAPKSTSIFAPQARTRGVRRMAQTSGTAPQFSDNTSRRKPSKGKGGGKKGC